MKAAVHTRYGPPDVVRIADVDKPTVTDHEVLVKVHATTVNRTDCGFRAAKPFIVRFFTGLIRPRVTVLGSEFAGVVEAVGEGVTAFTVGDRVFGYSEGRFGAHAEYLRFPTTVRSPPCRRTQPSSRPLRVPRVRTTRSRTSARQRSAAGSTCWSMARPEPSARRRSSSLKSLGASVTAVCGAPHVELVRGLGADRVIDYTAEDFTKDEQTYDVVFDAVGKSSFGRCKRLLKPRGIYLSSDLGPLSQNPLLALLTPLLGGKKVMFPIPPKHDQEMVRYFRDLIESGSVHAGHRPAVSVGPDRRGVPVRRDGPEDRQCRDQRRPSGLAARPSAQAGP